MQKATDSLLDTMKGSELKEKLAPFRQTQFDLAPKDFVADKSYRLSAVGDLMRGKDLEQSKDRFLRQCFRPDLRSRL